MLLCLAALPYGNTIHDDWVDVPCLAVPYRAVHAMNGDRSIDPPLVLLCTLALHTQAAARAGVHHQRGPQEENRGHGAGLDQRPGARHLREEGLESPQRSQGRGNFFRQGGRGGGR